ncbi:MAG: hypothetical protein WBP45_01495 [Daejeonella sp.]
MQTQTDPNPNGNTNSYVDTDTYLAACETALINSADSEIAPLLEARSYTPALLAAKQAELSAIKELVVTQKKEYGEQYDATQAYNNAVGLLHPDYMDHLALARVVLKNNTAAKTALGLKGKRARSESGYCSQGLLFYKNTLSNADYTAALAKVGVSEADLQSGKAGYEALSTQAAAKAKETGEAQGATARRDEAIDAFADWFSDFKEVAIIALRKTPQLREKLGWKE